MNKHDYEDYLHYLQDEYNSQAFLKNESFKEFNRKNLKSDIDNIKKKIDELQ